jgi:hypothetical protein
MNTNTDFNIKTAIAGKIFYACLLELTAITPNNPYSLFLKPSFFKRIYEILKYVNNV